jgi:hypothetical protein
MYRKLGNVYKNVGTNPYAYVQKFRTLNNKIGSFFTRDGNVLLDFNSRDILCEFQSTTTFNQCISCWETLGFVKKIGVKYLILFDTNDNDLIFRSKFNILLDSNNQLINQYRDSIILKILANFSNNINISE